MSDLETEEAEAPETIVTTVKPAPVPQTKRQPPYAIIVENDDLHTFAYVIVALCKICGHSPARAHELATAIDQNGRALVWSGALEVAELKRDQIREFGPDEFAPKPVTFPLGVYIEPLP